jgi:hypothetical protein
MDFGDHANHQDSRARRRAEKRWPQRGTEGTKRIRRVEEMKTGRRGEWEVRRVGE